MGNETDSPPAGAPIVADAPSRPPDRVASGGTPTSEIGVPLSLNQALDEVDLLLAFSAQKGLKIAADTFGAITRAKDQVRQEHHSVLDPQTEAAFWVAYQDIAERIKPATVASIKAGSDRYGIKVWTLRGRQRFSLARLAARRYQLISISALVFLLFLQLYAGMGSTILNDLRAMQQDALDKQQQVAELETTKKRTFEDLTQILSARAGDGALLLRFGQDSEAGDVGSALPAEGSVQASAPDTESGLREEIKRRLLEDVRRLSGEQVDASQELTFLRQDLDAKRALLRVWSPSLLAVTLPTADAIDVSAPVPVPVAPTPGASANATEAHDVGMVDDADGQSDGALAPRSGLFGASENAQAMTAPRSPTASATDLGFAGDLRPDGASDLGSQQGTILAGLIMLEALNVYILPLFYGLLGACAYVLRRLSTEIREYVYSPESDIRLKLRLYLGALSGFAVAWFLNQSTAPGVADSIAPLALAFVAGYSVEVVFAAMDSLVSAFSKQTDRSAGDQ